MYQSQYPPSSSSSTFPPPTGSSSGPYRTHMIPVQVKQPYTTASFPPPPVPPQTAFSPMPSGASAHSSRHHAPQQPHPPTQYQHYSRTANARYNVPPTSAGVQPQRHKGTLAPGQMVQIGDYQVRVERYLSEGGYAHVYLTTSEKPIYPPTQIEKRGRWGEKGYTQHCLKRIAFEDEAVWLDVKKEIQVMKYLPPNPHLTQYLASAHNRLSNGTHEVFILMEYCSGGGIIDLLNKRLRDRLKEVEILNIFTDVCEAVAAMHSLPQPLLHRDLKIENVLSVNSSSGPSPQRPMGLMFKLCDFGSTTFPANQPPTNKTQADALVLDLNKHTTLQYRSPEMVEPLLGLPVGLPSDVWALGVLLYKLCYYTTPFEEHGTLAIVNARYTFPQYPVYSPRLQHLIASMLVEQPSRRPTVFEILKTAHEMIGSKPEIDYPTPSRSLSSSQPRPAPSQRHQSNPNLLDFTSPASSIDRTPVMQPSLASSVQPQRRGRPTRESAPTFSISASQSQPNTLLKSLPSRPMAPPRPQVTGERPGAMNPPSPVDAFGMPSLANVGRSNSSGQSGFGDSFSAPQPRPGVASRQPSNTHLRRSSSTFGDTFSGVKGQTQGNEVRKVSQPTSMPGLSRSNTTLSRIEPKTSPARKPDGDSSFESRFPSIEVLALAGEPSRPPVSRPSSTSTNLLTPAMSSLPKPPLISKPSLMGNLTGGDLKSSQAPGTVQHAALPRSTNVTGTMFKNTLARPLRSSSPVRDQAESTEQRKAVYDKSPSLKAEVSPRLSTPDFITSHETHSVVLSIHQYQLSSFSSRRKVASSHRTLSTPLAKYGFWQTQLEFQ
ncbi:hypothetical protein TREMEDRAFT_73843 [Tremella mesenterica DSM 1558]|uniref:uncharacterized protein n=1 Tax=Tremella mesenterica (strain ATCC 24925 / CBS 8224 / DSM 1558 / NBRC 9311 / NRRL Y-6157 / RJB 2259-6 / UBC 559-6) TaxID=578456 RepID=UPI0003F48CE6|nr:uncharacterized protein TREMEDRAFT_73843 [Tremella mesenterica DSM 1558]EIW69409.1 hypothetical protein TREMEDRAFT_73843 [Tremella mesenterica DSM 1558]